MKWKIQWLRVYKAHHCNATYRFLSLVSTIKFIVCIHFFFVHFSSFQVTWFHNMHFVWSPVLFSGSTIPLNAFANSFFIFLLFMSAVFFCEKMPGINVQCLLSQSFEHVFLIIIQNMYFCSFSDIGFLLPNLNLLQENNVLLIITRQIL